MITLYPHQRAAIDALYDWFRANKDGNPLLVLPTGCHARGTQVLMIDGSTKAVEYIQVNDVLVGPDSKPRNVLQTIHGIEPMYRIKPNKGPAFVVNENHVLSLMTTNEGKSYPSNTKSGAIEFITVKEYLGKSKYWKHLRKLYRSSAIEFSSKSSPELDPWALGALLGDGYIKQGVRFISPDIDILDPLLDEMRRHGLTFSESNTYSITKNIECWHVSFVGNNKSGPKGNRVAEILKEIGLYGKTAEGKFIPDIYKTGSVEVRKNVLAGLLDTDGHLHLGGYDYVSKSKKLAEDVVFIARSLGLSANISISEKYCQTGGGGLYWRVSISGELSSLPLRCERKRASPRLQKKNPLVTGFSIELIGVDDFFGFTLDQDHLYLTGDFVVHHNSGKSVVLAAVIQEIFATWPDQRVLMLTHVKELIEQNASRLKTVWPQAPLGIYSAGLGRKDAFNPVIFAGIQSVFAKAMHLGRFDLIFVDEAHLIGSDSGSRYQVFFDAARKINPDVRIVGLTATAFRTTTGALTYGDMALFSDVAYEIGLLQLIAEGFLCPLVTKSTTTQLDVSGVKSRNGEFIQGQLERAVDQDSVTHAALDEVETYGADRGKWLVFCAGVNHAEHVTAALLARGIPAGCVTGKTPKGRRDNLIASYRNGRIRALVNANVLTTGFDVPATDLLVVLRPTQSPGLYVQIMGRGMRIAPGKTDCLVLDFAGNTTRHGPVDQVKAWIPKPKEDGSAAPIKVCPGCGAKVATSVRICACGHVFEFADAPSHFATASDAPVLSTDTKSLVTRKVSHCFYRHHQSIGKLPSLRVDYYDGMLRVASEWVCLSHDGYARAKAAQWWIRRVGTAIPVPPTVKDALDLPLSDIVKQPKTLTLKQGKYVEIVGYEFE